MNFFASETLSWRGTWTDTDRQRHTDYNSQEGKCCGSKDCLLVSPSASRMWTFQWMVPFSWVIWTTQIGFWGLLKASRGYKVGRGGPEEGELQGEVGNRYDQNTFYEIGKELVKHIKKECGLSVFVRGRCLLFIV